MSIAFKSDESQLQKLRERLRQMADDELIKFGKDVRKLSGPIVGPTPEPMEGTIGRSACRVEAEAPDTVMEGRGRKPLRSVGCDLLPGVVSVR